MQRVKVTISHNPKDPADDLRCAAQVRRDLWAHSPVEIDPDSPVHGTHRDDKRNAYFVFATDRLKEVHRVLRDYGYSERTSVEIVEEGAGSECVNCGNISPEMTTECPTCKFRDIDPCPYCNNEVARLAYTPVSGDLFKCPQCGHRVRLHLNDPMFDADGHYNQPLVHVVPAEAPVNES